MTRLGPVLLNHAFKGFRRTDLDVERRQQPSPTPSMSYIKTIPLLCVLFAALLLPACACAPQETHAAPIEKPSENSPVSSTTQPAAPFMFNEADLSQGSPGPGPVGQIIIKEYPPYRAAKTSAASVGGENRMFMALFNHIKANNIAMTAPVVMTYNPDSPATQTVKPESMLFLYRTPTMGTPGNAGKVQVADFPAVTVVSITYRGSYNSAYSNCMPQLQAWLKEHESQYRVDGPPRFLGYNSPFVPWFLQIGEMQIPIQPI
jgi:effector-binding domain-containing protein